MQHSHFESKQILQRQQEVCKFTAHGRNDFGHANHSFPSFDCGNIENQLLTIWISSLKETLP